MIRGYLIFGLLLLMGLFYSNYIGWSILRSANGAPWRHHYGGSMHYYHK